MHVLKESRSFFNVYLTPGTIIQTFGIPSLTMGSVKSEGIGETERKVDTRELRDLDKAGF